jgi:hypothetical protein
MVLGHDGRVRVTWIALSLAPLIACGGRVAGGDDGGPLPAASATNGNPSSSDFPVCPPEAPAVGSSCAIPAEQGCAYVVLPSTTTTCKAFVCDESGHWQSSTSGC